MSTTDQRTGFRLPWSTEGRARDSETDAEATDGAEHPDSVTAEANADETAVAFTPEALAAEAAAEATAEGTAEATAESPTATDETANETDAPEAADDESTEAVAETSGEPVEDMTWPEVDRRVRQMGRRAVDRADAALADIQAGGAATGRKTNALMAGLSKAMHAAAEGARVETLERLAANAAERTEAIKAGAADEAAAIKQAAENDIAGVREWSKSELARVREETDRKIAERRAALEHETEAHVARIDIRVDRVQRIVATFESTMAEFFENLLAETDPARVALLAEQLPEAPSLEVDDELESAFEAFEAAADAHDAEASVATETIEDELIGDTPELIGDAPDLIGDTPELIGDAPEASALTDAYAVATETEAEPEVDPAAAAAEAEAQAYEAAEQTPVMDEGEVDAVTTALSEDALAARLAKMETAEAATASDAKTELIVSGLVSVAGIAGFKRAVSHIAGVTNVGVTSGPGGEFVYSVSHSPDTDFRAAITALPEFKARVTGESEGSLQIAATDSQRDN